MKRFLIILIGFLLLTSNSFSQDIIGKLIVGYQGWFACQGDQSPKNNWVHWARRSQPSPGNQTFELYPDMREYAKTYQTGYANLGNGQPATLFSSYDNQVINKHFEWMQTYGIDCAALQRFGSELSNDTLKLQRNGIAANVKIAAQTYGRKFYIMYDISSWKKFQSEIKTDWKNTIIDSLKLLSSSAYAKEIVNGISKPVVCIWGFGSNGRPGDSASYIDVVNWFKAQNCYIILGVNNTWRSQESFLPAFKLANMISPWSVGRFGDNASADNFAEKFLQEDFTFCKNNNIEYLPVVWPGFAWSNWNGGLPNAKPRNHGGFMWHQFYNVKKIGISNIYVAMFDEYDEGTAIAKAAENASMIPTNQYFLTLDADSVTCSSDFYLRLVDDGGKMVKGKIALTDMHPTPHTIPVTKE